MQPHRPLDIVLHGFDPLGREIVARAGRWGGHIEHRHPEVDQHFDAVRRTLTDPYRVMRDAVYADRSNYYRAAALPKPYDRLYLKVCVWFRPSGLTGSLGEVVTADPRGKIGHGEVQLWP